MSEELGIPPTPEKLAEAVLKPRKRRKPPSEGS